MSTVGDLFRLSERHIKAIEAQIQLIVHDGGYGAVGLVIHNHRIARITTETSDKFEDGNGDWAQNDVLKPPPPKRDAKRKE